MIVNCDNHKIICTAHAEGKKHDFKLYEDSIGCAVSSGIEALLDSGYQGIAKLHANNRIPHKKPRGGELTPEEKADNRQLSGMRILIENIIAKVKVFKILAHKYRNRRKRFGLRMALICGFINFENIALR